MSDEKMHHEEQFVISYELLYLLDWLLKYQEAELSQIVTQAFLKGYEEKLKQQTLYDQIQRSDNIGHSITKFLNFLENTITDVYQMQQEKKISHQNIIKTLDQIDPDIIDYETIKSTVLATADKLDLINQEEARRLFLKELLKQWNPHKEKDKIGIIKN